MFPYYTSIVVTQARTAALKRTVTRNVLPEWQKSAMTAHRANTAAAIAGATFFAAFGVLIWAAIASPITSAFFLATLGSAGGIGLVAIILFVNAGQKDTKAECLKEIDDDFESDMTKRVAIAPDQAFKKMGDEEKLAFLTLLTEDLRELVNNLPQNDDDVLLTALERGLATQGLFGINDQVCSLKNVVEQTQAYQSTPLLKTLNQYVKKLTRTTYALEQRIDAQERTGSDSDDYASWTEDDVCTSDTD